jgi:hypothetical protein
MRLFLSGFIIVLLPAVFITLMILGACARSPMTISIGGIGTCCSQPLYVIWTIIVGMQVFSRNAELIGGII